MNNINKKGIWTTPIFHELYGLNITYSPYNDTERSYIPTTGINSTFAPNPYYILFSDFDLGEKMRIIMKIGYEGFDTSNSDGTFNFYFQGAKRNDTGGNVWSGANELTNALNNYQNLKDLVLSQTSGTFIYNTTFIISETYYTSYAGCNISTRSDYSNGTAKFTMYKPIIFPDKYYIDTNSIVKQADDFLSCKEIIEY